MDKIINFSIRIGSNCETLLSFLPPFSTVRKYTSTQNLGNCDRDTGVPLYQIKDPKGYSAAEGEAFEDLTVLRWQNEGKHVERVEPYYHGEDLIVDGKKLQLKCGHVPYCSARALYKEPHGEYSYGSQQACVPSDHVRAVEKVVSIRKNMGYGGPDEVIAGPCTSDEVKNYAYQGVPSMLMDAKDPNLYMPAIGTGAAIACAGLATDLFINRDNLSFGKVALKTLAWTAAGAIISGATLFLECAGRQPLRAIS